MKAETKFIVCLVLNVCIFVSNLFQRSRAIFQSKNTQIYNAGI